MSEVLCQRPAVPVLDLDHLVQQVSPTSFVLSPHLTMFHSVPETCSHNYGEVRGKISVPGANVVSGPKCCNGACLQTLVVKNEL